MTGSLAIEIRPLAELDHLLPLLAIAEAEGWSMVSRLVADWRTGVNRFHSPGEALLVAAIVTDIVGECGLNLDPFAGSAAVGRVRRLYVAPAWRRRGVGSALVGAILSTAEGSFEIVHVRTYDRGAAAFYRSLGFVDVIDDPYCTQRRPVAA